MKKAAEKLLWKLLFFRLIGSQKRLFVFAIITVALGVALALGIRLGTESATRSLEENLPLAENPEWSEPLTMQGPEAFAFIRSMALRLPMRAFSLIEAQGVRNGVFSEELVSIQIVYPWSGELADAEGVAIQDSCSKEFAGFSAVRIGGRSFPLQLMSAGGLKAAPQSCRTALINPESLEGNAPFQDALELELKRAPLLVMFKQTDAAEKLAVEEFKTFAAQVSGIDFSNEQKRIDRLRDVTRSFRTNLQLMGFIALFIGFALVHHIFSLLIARQSKTLATLSALGIARSKQIRVLLALAGVVGLLASSLGTMLGLAAGAFLSWVTSATVKNLYDTFVDSTRFYWQPADLLYGFVLGFSACFLGSLHPIAKIRALPVAQIMRDGGFESHQTGLSRRQSILLASGLAVVSALFLRWTVVWNRIPITALAACLGFLVVAALSAQLIAQSFYESGRLQPRSRQWRKNLRLFMPPQAAVIVQVLTLTFTLTFGVKGMAESFRRTVADWAQSALRADLWIRSIGGASGSLPDHLLERLEKARGTEAIAIDSLTVLPAFLALDASSESKPVLFANAHMGDQAKVAPMRFILPEDADKKIQKDLAGEIAKAARDCSGTRENPCPAYISEPVQVHFALADPLEKVLCPDIQSRRICFRIKAVYQDFGSDQGVILSDKSIYERLSGEKLRPSFANVYLPVSIAGSVTQLESDLRNFAESSEGTLGFETLAELQRRILETFDNTFRVTDALYVLCGIIAIVATVSSLNMQILLRRREWNIQWALGIGHRALGRRFALWSALMATLAATMSVFGGIVLSAVLVYTVNYYSFGYSLSLMIPWHLPVVLIAVAAVSGYLSGRMQQKSLVASLSAQRMMQD